MQNTQKRFRISLELKGAKMNVFLVIIDIIFLICGVIGWGRIASQWSLMISLLMFIEAVLTFILFICESIIPGSISISFLLISLIAAPLIILLVFFILRVLE